MFLMFTPFTYLFMFSYLLILSYMFMIMNFYVFWMYMELLMLLFLGVAYTLFSNSYTQLMLYFLIQTLASFSILVFYLLETPYLFIMSIFLKLAMFPFFSWYINVLYRFPNFPLILASTLHKLPPLLIIYNFLPNSYHSFLFVGILFTLFFSGIYMLVVSDLRYLLIVSSMGNNSWMLMGLMNSFLLFFIFFVLYSINLFLILNILMNTSKFNVTYNRYQSSYIIYLFILLLNMAALPPMPMFFSKLLLLYGVYFNSYFSSFTILILVMLLNVMMMISYVQCFIKFIVNVYSNSNNYFMF